MCWTYSWGCYTFPSCPFSCSLSCSSCFSSSFCPALDMAKKIQNPQSKRQPLNTGWCCSILIVSCDFGFWWCCRCWSVALVLVICSTAGVGKLWCWWGCRGLKFMVLVMLQVLVICGADGAVGVGLCGAGGVNGRYLRMPRCRVRGITTNAVTCTPQQH